MNFTFLKDVAFLSVTAFGGPQAHIAMMLDYLVAKKKYLNEKELIELNALCSLLPGPTSTQTITSIGYKLGGPLNAFLTLLIWGFPAVVLMSAFSFGYVYLSKNQISLDFLQFIKPMAVGFIAVAAYKIGKKVVFDKLTAILLLISAGISVFYRAPWLFPIILILGGIASNIFNIEKSVSNKVSINPQWGYLILFAAIFIVAEILMFTIGTKPFVLFENFYRFGSLIFGGGQVLIPFMHQQMVEHSAFMTNDEFLTGFGLVQGLPGPVFSFSAFAGGISMNDQGFLYQLLGCVIGAIGIFLPGTILIFFIYPLWEDLKGLAVIKKSLAGVNATAAGLVVAAAIILFFALDVNMINTTVVLATMAVLIFTKLPSPVLVIVAIVAGFLV